MARGRCCGRSSRELHLPPFDMALGPSRDIGMPRGRQSIPEASCCPATLWRMLEVRLRGSMPRRSLRSAFRSPPLPRADSAPLPQPGGQSSRVSPWALPPAWRCRSPLLSSSRDPRFDKRHERGVVRVFGKIQRWAESREKRPTERSHPSPASPPQGKFDVIQPRLRDRVGLVNPASDGYMRMSLARSALGLKSVGAGCVERGSRFGVCFEFQPWPDEGIVLPV